MNDFQLQYVRWFFLFCEWPKLAFHHINLGLWLIEGLISSGADESVFSSIKQGQRCRILYGRMLPWQHPVPAQGPDTMRQELLNQNFADQATMGGGRFIVLCRTDGILTENKDWNLNNIIPNLLVMQNVSKSSRGEEKWMTECNTCFLICIRDGTKGVYCLCTNITIQSHFFNCRPLYSFNYNKMYLNFVMHSCNPAVGQVFFMR